MCSWACVGANGSGLAAFRDADLVLDWISPGFTRGDFHVAPPGRCMAASQTPSPPTLFSKLLMGHDFAT